MHPTTHHRLPALDGLRGLAVAAVLAYHLGWAGARGGFLGVSLFFTLSGYLICGRLLAERDATGTVDLRSFWARRARRLLPASLAALGLVVAYGVAAASDGQLRDLRIDILSAVAQVANWRFVLDGTSYGELGQAPSPVQHFWSLAIEEQSYLVLPLVVLVARRRLGVVLAVALAASVVAMAAADDLTRAYYGTDTRAAELLVGALLAVAVRGRGAPGRAVRLAAPACLALVLWSWAVVDHADPRLYGGGLVAHAALVAVVLRAASGSGGLVAALGAAPLRWLGRLSYGAYLYHWPLLLWLTPQRTGLDGLALDGVRVAATLALAHVSHRALEEPILSGRRLGTSMARPALVGGVAVVVAAAVVALPAPPAPDALSRAMASAGTGLVAPASAPSSPAASVAPPTWPSAEVARAFAAAPAATEPSSGPGTPLRPGERLRVYVAGDSNALALGLALAEWGRANEVDVWTSGWIGCHLVPGGRYRYAGVEETTTQKCDTWPEQRRAEVADARPHVVLAVVGAFDVLDRRLPGEAGWEHIGQARFDALLRRQVATLTDLGAAAGARVVWATYPAIRTGTVDGVPPEADHPENDVRRIDRLNAIIREVARSRPGTRIVDYRGKMARWPGGELDPVRRPDGVHPSGAELPELAEWVGARVVAMARRTA